MTRAAAVAAPAIAEELKWTDFADEIQELRLDELEPSPFNTRVIREDDALRELAESIKADGVNQPIIVRSIEIEGDVVKLEIVAGHRRWRASHLAGRETIPGIVRELTDDEARRIQITENLQRQELPALEEARAFYEAMMLNGGKMLTVKELAARLGKSPVYIHRRLTLLDAIVPVQDALSKGLIEVGHALELARLSEAEQQRLLYWLGVAVEAGVHIQDDEDDEDAEVDADEICDDQVGRPTAKSVVELKKYIANTTLQVLGKAPFDPNDAGLVEEAGSCADCLKRSGLSPMLFSDVQQADICTDRDCFNGKVEAHIARKMAEAKKAKTPLHQITGEWNKSGPQVHRDYNVTEANGKRCGFLVQAIHVDGRDVGKTVEICIGTECKVHGRGSGRSSSPKQTEKQKAERKDLLAKVKAEKTYRLRLLKECLAKPIDVAPTDEMVRHLVLFAVGRFDNTKEAQLAEVLGWNKDTFSWSGKKTLELRIASLTQADAIRIALVGLEANELTVHEQEISNKRELGLEQVAKLIGVDLAKVRKSLEPEKEAKPALKKGSKAPAKKAAKKKAKAAKPARAKAAIERDELDEMEELEDDDGGDA